MDYDVIYLEKKLSKVEDILGASSTLQLQELSDDDRSTLLSGIQRDAQWLVRVTENLLSVTRLVGDNVVIKKEDEVLEEIIGSAILKYHSTLGTLPVEVDSPDEILVVPVDGVLIEQVLINLLDNVSAHAEGATKIWLHVSRENSDVVVSVEDDGAGISPLQFPHLMDGTVHSTGQSRSDGHRNMGIGLSVCRTIICAHGGSLRAEKSKHGGAALQFNLPIKEDTNDQQLSS